MFWQIDNLFRHKAEGFPAGRGDAPAPTPPETAEDAPDTGPGPASLTRLLADPRHVVAVCAKAALRPRRCLALLDQWRLIGASDFFDARWYLRANPDIREYAPGPLWHFVLHGHREGRDPSPRFITKDYLMRNPDVLQSGDNALVHYLRHGIAEGRRPGIAITPFGGDVHSLLANGPVRIITSPHNSYVAHLIQAQLEPMGIPSVIDDEYRPGVNDDSLYFAIAPQALGALPPAYVAFQMEQYTTDRWFTPGYLDTLGRAVAVLDFSPFNIEKLRGGGISLEKLYYQPMGALPDAGRLRSGEVSAAAREHPPIDVLFYGDTSCPRRKRILERLEARFNVVRMSEVYGADKAAMIQKAKVVVNVHYYETALLETSRICESLSLGTAVVSEAAIDQAEHADLVAVVDFVAPDDVEALAQRIGRLLSDDGFRARRQGDIRRFVETDNKFAKYFRRFMLGIGLIDFAAFSEQDDFLPPPGPEPQRLCISMSETPTRTRQFLQAPDHGFRLVEGLRHPVRWVGCGMSYKYYLGRLRRMSEAPIIICEDDVVLPPNFNDTLEKVLRYLGRTERQWHIFSGYIAEIHPEGRVLHVEDHEGIRYVYLDTMTSGVMNVYSPEAADIACLWDEADPRGMQIDRHLESWPGLVTVVTLPYLVDHADDQVSSIMDQRNSVYTTMAQEAQNQLRQMVRDYLDRPGGDTGHQAHLAGAPREAQFLSALKDENTA